MKNWLVKKKSVSLQKSGRAIMLMELDFEIDKLTNSIENVKTGDRFLTEISLLGNKELSKISTKNGWRFNWKAETKLPERGL